MPITERTVLLPANAVNLIVTINHNEVTNFKMGVPAVISLPDLVQRALMIHHETGVMPTKETVTT